MRIRQLIAMAAITTVTLAGCTLEGGGGGTPGLERSGDSIAASIAPDGPFDEFRESVYGATEGRTLAYVPGGMGNDAQTQWADTMKADAEAMGMEFVLRDPAWDRNKQAQATETLINQLNEGDVLVLNPADVTLLSSHVERAAQNGIYTIVLNQESSYLGDVFIGGDFIEMGRRTAEDLVEVCGPGTSQKVAIIEGDSTGGIAKLMKEGSAPIFEANPDLEIVSEQNGAFDPKTSYDIMAVTITQHPDLCGAWVQWDPMARAAGNAIAEAGKKGQVSIFTYDAVAACDSIQEGLITASYADSRTNDGEIIVALATMLIQSGVQPGAQHFGYFSPTQRIDSSNADQDGLCYGQATS